MFKEILNYYSGFLCGERQQHPSQWGGSGLTAHRLLVKILLGQHPLGGFKEASRPALGVYF
ncbi:MAG: hypothetical protein LBT47_09595 [Deltaproteobacteria bacterium]|nr:hypothetical protein [Deltaproteobacteria bacterium]